MSHLQYYDMLKSKEKKTKKKLKSKEKCRTSFQDLPVSVENEDTKDFIIRDSLFDCSPHSYQ